MGQPLVPRQERIKGLVKGLKCLPEVIFPDLTRKQDDKVVWIREE
jgi:hypothetical protein